MYNNKKQVWIKEGDSWKVEQKLQCLLITELGTLSRVGRVPSSCCLLTVASPPGESVSGKGMWECKSTRIKTIVASWAVGAQVAIGGRHPAILFTSFTFSLVIVFVCHFCINTFFLTFIFLFLAVIFFSLLLLLLILSIILLYQLAQDDAQLQLYLEHYSLNWISALILFLTIATLFFAFTIVIFSIYMLKRSSNDTSSGRPLSLGRNINEENRYFRETISTRTVTRTRPSNTQESSSQRLFGSKQQRLVESLHVEKSITFH